MMRKTSASLSERIYDWFFRHVLGMGPPPYVPQRVIAHTGTAQAPATANAAAVDTIPAKAGGYRDVSSVRWSYSAAPTAGSTLTIAWTSEADGSTAYSQTYYVAAGGPGMLLFNPPLTVPVGTAVTATLAAGGSGVKGSVYLSYGAAATPGPAPSTTSTTTTTT